MPGGIGKRKQEERFTAMLRCFEPDFAAAQDRPRSGGNLINLYPQEDLTIDTTIAAGDIETYVSPTFYVPKVSWLVQRNGMDAGRSLMYSLNGSEGNHQHANGLSVEFYGKGLTLGPDAASGSPCIPVWTIWSITASSPVTIRFVWTAFLLIP